MESTSVSFAAYDFVSVPTIVPLFRPIFSPTKPHSSLPFDQGLKKEDEANARVMLLEKHNLFIIWPTGIEAFKEMESLVMNKL
ncbi:hypothetical protein CUMW_135950 [Citrus unshiu]|nr:hypothetical protein CUMW_135950 [Citrus unshiu]